MIANYVTKALGARTGDLAVHYNYIPQAIIFLPIVAESLDLSDLIGFSITRQAKKSRA